MANKPTFKSITFFIHSLIEELRHLVKCRNSILLINFVRNGFRSSLFCHFFSNTISHSTPLPLGEGQGGGAACYVLFFIFHPPFHSSIHNLLHAVEDLIDITLF